MLDPKGTAKMKVVVRFALLVGVAYSLAACGSVATNIELAPTKFLPTLVPVIVPTEAGAVATIAQPPTMTPTEVPPTAVAVAVTQVPATATRSFATATPNLTAVPGNAEAGKVLFEKGTGNEAIPLCSTCHNVVDDGTVKVGPLMGGIASRAKDRVKGEDAYTYIRTSIIAPNAYFVEEAGKTYKAGNASLMYQTYAKDLTEAQITDIVAYLMTLK
jgi:cytochrome c2